jgi:selenocysteine-specific elongation factor
MLSEEGRLTFLEDMVAVRGREVQLSRDGMNIKEMIQNLLREASYAPPFLSEIPAMLQADPAESRKICFWMVKEKLLTRVSDEMVYLPATLDDMKQRIRARYPAGARFGVAEFKELFNLTRKHAIPLLEHFDREHFTRRQGNERILL